MSNNDINKWLEQARAKNLSDMEIQKELKNQGWNNEQINKILVGAYHEKKNIFDNEKIANNSIEKNGNISSSTTPFPSISDLFRYSWDLYKKKLGKLLIVFIVSGLIGSVLLTIVAAIFLYFFYNGLTIIGGFFHPSPFLLFFLGLISMFLYVSLTVLVFTLIQITLILTIHHEKVSIGTILGNSFKLILPMWWLNIIVGFLIMGASILFGIPGIIFSVWFSLAIFILVIENVRGMQAILKSKEYVRNYWWQVLISNIVLMFALGLPIMILNYILVLMDQYIIGQIISNIFYILALPFGFCYNYAIYRSLSDLKGKNIPVPQKKWHLITTSVIGLIIIPIIFGIMATAITRFKF